MKSNKISTQKQKSFFILTPDVRDALLLANLTAAEWRIWTYLVSLDPFGDRGAKFSPAELMLKCEVKKTTYFVAKAKFQKLGIFNFQDGTTKVFNRYGTASPINHSQQGLLIESEISESQSEISDSQSEISESNTIYRARAQTLQKNQTFHTKKEEDFFDKDRRDITIDKTEVIKSEVQNSKQEDKENAEATIKTPEVMKSEVQNSEGELEKEQSQETKIDSKNQISRETNQENVEISDETRKKLKKYGVNLAKKTDESQFSGIPKDLYEKLKELDISLDAKVRDAIAAHDLSQAYGAIAHIERTRSTIQNTRGVFLYQLSKQSVTNRQKSEDHRRKKEAEFLAWYEVAIADGIVEDVPVSYLSRDCKNQPLVRLKQTDPKARPPYRIEPWKNVRDRKTNYVEPDKNCLKQMRETIEQIKANLKPKNLGYSI